MSALRSFSSSSLRLSSSSRRFSASACWLCSSAARSLSAVPSPPTAPIGADVLLGFTAFGARLLAMPRYAALLALFALALVDVLCQSAG